MVLSLTEGRTFPLDFVLKVAGVAFPFDPADTVTLILKTQDGRLIETTANVTKLAVDPAAVPPIGPGTVRYAPDASDLAAKNSPYLARWKVTTATGIVFFPEGPEDTWRVFLP